MNGVDNLSVESFFSFSDVNVTRNAEGKIFVKHRNINKRAYCFSNRVVKLWNSIPVEIRCTRSNNINKFKNFLDNNAGFKNLFMEID